MFVSSQKSGLDVNGFGTSCHVQNFEPPKPDLFIKTVLHGKEIIFHEVKVESTRVPKQKGLGQWDETQYAARGLGIEENIT
ncbi:MAG: hypothetical protein NPIRA05_11080 [Nitrospirales bacterium]|nr:MAG: hypothetical protein NPIRA05_11080 [Nitrospirales bacterium]